MTSDLVTESDQEPAQQAQLGEETSTSRSKALSISKQAGFVQEMEASSAEPLEEEGQVAMDKAERKTQKTSSSQRSTKQSKITGVRPNDLVFGLNDNFFLIELVSFISSSDLPPRGPQLNYNLRT